MLLTYEPSPYPIGIAINSWKTRRRFMLFGGKLRIFVIFPIVHNGQDLMEVGQVLEEKNKLMPVKPPRQEWRHLSDGPNDGFGDEAEGYPVDFETAKDLYAVLKDGALAQPEASKRLYEKYKYLVDYYSFPAQQFLEKEHDHILRQIEEKDWYKGLRPVPGSVIDFPYKQ